MALSYTGTAIGKVSSLLSDQMNSRTGLSITVGRPDPPPGSAGLNLLLYEVELDASMRNVPIESDAPAPLWLVLKYLLTAFDDSGSSDSTDAHENLGSGMRALQELSFLLLNDNTDAATRQALEDNPEPLKLTFDQATSELLSSIMQGTEERYRCSAAFQIRPVLIAPELPAAYPGLVGVDYSQDSAVIEPGAALQTTVIPGLGPVLHELSPANFQEGESIEITGEDLHTVDALYLGDRELPVTLQRPDRLGALVQTGAELSPGLYSLTARQALDGDKFLASNPVAAGLVPHLQTVQVPAPLTLLEDRLTGVVELTGSQLGTLEDQRFVAFIDGDGITQVFDSFQDPGDVPSQTIIRVEIPAPGLLPGSYRIGLKINGMRARAMPTILLEAPP